MHLARGVNKFKCATLQEAKAAADAGASDVLIAFQPVGPNGVKIRDLSTLFPTTQFSTIADDEQVLRELNASFTGFRKQLPVYIDVDCGMHRTGVRPENAARLYRTLSELKNLRSAGLHVYDGHLHETDQKKREELCERAFAPVLKLRSDLESSGLSVPGMVAGGTPTFPLHAKKEDRECSPGTYVFWDFGYEGKLPDLKFEIAAVLLTRVVSKPGENLLCLDLGHKAVAAENPHPRVQFFDLPDAKAVTHSEEHLVIETPQASAFKVGDTLYGVPRHICPTVALYDSILAVENRAAKTSWNVARGRL
jgi:D-serine deaminase-like pyridoxal phosphate-dependent protein